MTTQMLVRRRPDTSDMVVLHRVFRREFGLAPDLVRAVPDGDVARADYLAGHLTLLLVGLRHHHAVEDELLWPRLVERATLRADLVHRMQAQHARVAAFTTGVETLLPLWRSAAREDIRDRLAELLYDLGRALDGHIAEEELEVFPLAADYLSADEWALLGERSRVGIKRSDMMIFLGAMLENAEPAERLRFVDHLPGPIRLFWRFVGHRRYERRVARIRAT